MAEQGYITVGNGWETLARPFAQAAATARRWEAEGKWNVHVKLDQGRILENHHWATVEETNGR